MNDIKNETALVSNKQSLAIPVAIIIGFAFIAAAIYLSAGKNSDEAAPRNVSEADNATATSKINPITEDDHIRGNPNAPIMIVEYSDFDCPYCKQFHTTMQQIMNDFGADGQVAWVYRHLPLESLHPSAPYLALASECVAGLGGNDSFWKFTDLVFGERGFNEQTNLARLEEFATTAGVDGKAFNNCLDKQDKKDQVTEDFNNAVDIGAYKTGTPYSIILIGDQQIVINGAQPYAIVKQMITSLLSQI